MNKKGAIELSMTTIIIIVIGVTILSLGLVWINSLMGQIGDLTDKAISGGQKQVEDLMGQSDETLNLYSNSIDLKRGDYTQVGVVVYNKEGTAQDFTLKAEMGSLSAGKGDVDCLIAEAEGHEDSISGIVSGEKKSRIILISDEGSSPLGLYTCIVTLQYGQKTEETSITINLE